jgi:molybdate/tungstate transport system substrate-binding protein
VGPQNDPAEVGKAKSAHEAFAKIAKAESKFLSRGDNSGTHKKELKIWTLSGIQPAGKWYVVTHDFMGPTLMKADRESGYFMTDSSTYYVKRKNLKNLKILFRGDPILVNVYHALVSSPSKVPRERYDLAVAFVNFLKSEQGQGIYRQFGIKRYGTALYNDAEYAKHYLKTDVSGKVIIFNAGSLTIPLARMEKEFEAKYPEVDVLRESAGSRKCARKITDLEKPCDIMASADYTVIDQLLIPAYADWNVRFATNRLVLCYTDKSNHAGEINAQNWYEILQKKGVVWGHSDPNLDPCGYRSVMVLQLAEEYYKKPGLFKKLIGNRPKENIRPKSVELVSLLQTGNMDYAWEYRSVAVQHELKFVELPDQINLGNYKYDTFYKNAVVMVTGKKPGTFLEKKGKSCTYGITLLKNAPNAQAATAFLEYMLDPEGGLKILQEMGQPPFIPCRIPTAEMKVTLPKVLQHLVELRE